MNVTVRYHGIIGDMLRRKTQQVEIPDGATVTDLLAIVTGGDEGAQSILKQTRAFVDGKQADRTMPLADGAEVTFMRPIAGGAASLRGSRLRLRGEGREETDDDSTPAPRPASPLSPRSGQHPLKPQRG